MAEVSDVPELSPKDEANKKKALGNEALKERRYPAAVNHYSEAIKLDPDNHVLWSNRSAAYVYLRQNLKAVEDAEQCIKLNDKWAKGYGRKARALYAMRRYSEAEKAYKAGLKIDPENVSLQEGLDLTQGAIAVGSAFMADDGNTLGGGFGATSEQGGGGGGGGGAAGGGDDAGEGGDDDEDALLDSFFDEVEELKQETESSKAKITKKDTWDAGDTRKQIDRLLQRNYKFINLNPFEVFQLPPTATDEDIKARFRKLSAMVHPDKTSDPRATDAFNEVKKAHKVLTDEDRKTLTIQWIDRATKEATKARKKLLKSGRLEASLEPLSDMIRTETRKQFAILEHRRSNFVERAQKQEARELAEEMDKVEEESQRLKVEQEWAKGREKRMSSWTDFSKAKRRRAGVVAPKDTIVKEETIGAKMAKPPPVSKKSKKKRPTA